MNVPMPKFADRMSTIPESFIREILKVATTPDVISFAGGLPNPLYFPIEKLAVAAEKVISQDGRTALQYAPTEGYLPLRDYLAQRQSAKEGLRIDPEQLIILNGSQQGLDLVAKLFCNKNEPVLLEEPSYLGAIQAFSAYEPTFHSIRLVEDGPDPVEFNNVTRKARPCFFYSIPNFQNPTGACYSATRRMDLVESQYHSGMLWVEDNPYGEIYFERGDDPDFHSLIPEKTIYLGSFSKMVSPGLRLGWATGPAAIIRKMVVAKQASDLHSNNLAQRIIYQFLCDYSLDDHLHTVRTFYREQASLMVSLLKEHLPQAKFIQPKGGMFLWIVLPEAIDASVFLQETMKEKVIFVPGNYFFLDKQKGRNTIRLNFSNPSREEMINGIRIMGHVLNRMTDVVAAASL
jgi:2-aminoadipate transaminase